MRKKIFYHSLLTICLVCSIIFSCKKDEELPELKFDFSVKSSIENIENGLGTNDIVPIELSINKEYKTGAKLFFSIENNKTGFSLTGENGEPIKVNQKYPINSDVIKLKYKGLEAGNHKISFTFSNSKNVVVTKEVNLNFQSFGFDVSHNTHTNIYQGQNVNYVLKIKPTEPIQNDEYYIMFETNPITPNHQESHFSINGVVPKYNQWIKISNLDNTPISFNSFLSGTISLKMKIKNKTTERAYTIEQNFQKRSINIQNLNFEKTITKTKNEGLKLVGTIVTKPTENNVYYTSSINLSNRGIETKTKEKYTLGSGGSNFYLNIKTFEKGEYKYTIKIEDKYGNFAEKVFEPIIIQQNDFNVTISPLSQKTVVGTPFRLEYQLTAISNNDPANTPYSFTFDDGGNKGYITFEIGSNIQFQAGQEIKVHAGEKNNLFYVSPNKGAKVIKFTFKSGSNIKPVISINQEFIGEDFETSLNPISKEIMATKPFNFQLKINIPAHHASVKYFASFTNLTVNYNGKVYAPNENIPIDVIQGTNSIDAEGTFGTNGTSTNGNFTGIVTNSSGISKSININRPKIIEPITLTGGFLRYDYWHYETKQDCPVFCNTRHYHKYLMNFGIQNNHFVDSYFDKSKITLEFYLEKKGEGMHLVATENYNAIKTNKTIKAILDPGDPAWRDSQDPFIDHLKIIIKYDGKPVYEIENIRGFKYSHKSTINYKTFPTGRIIWSGYNILN